MKKNDTRDSLHELPTELPVNYREEYVPWVKRRDGFRRELFRACYGPDIINPTKKADFAAALEGWMAEHADRIECAPRLRKGIQEALSAFFYNRDQSDLPLPFLSAVLTHLDVRSEELGGWLHPAPPFDVWRAAWSGDGGPKPLELDDFGMRLHRVQPSAAQRALNAYRRSWTETPLPHDGVRFRQPHDGMYTSPSSGFIYVDAGHVRASFLGVKTMDLKSGTGLLYNMRHPHRFHPGLASSVTLDVTANIHGGVPSELFLNPWTTTAFDDLPDPEHLVLDSVRRLVAFTLSSTHMPAEELAKHTKLKRARLTRIARGLVVPKLDEVLEVAHLCRVPEEALFTPYSKYMRDHVFQGDPTSTWEAPRPFELLGELDAFESVQPESDTWYLQPAEDQLDPDKPAWEMYRLGRPPSLVPGASDTLEVGVFVCRGPADPELAYPREHDELHPSEELLFVVKGRLGVRLRLRDGNVCNGILERGDAIWFNARMGHTFWAPDGESRAIHFRQSFPARRGADGAGFSGR